MKAVRHNRVYGGVINIPGDIITGRVSPDSERSGSPRRMMKTDRNTLQRRGGERAGFSDREKSWMRWTRDPPAFWRRRRAGYVVDQSTRVRSTTHAAAARPITDDKAAADRQTEGTWRERWDGRRRTRAI